MKTGDLVTLSAYGRRLVHVSSYMNSRKWSKHDGKDKPMYGLVTMVIPPREDRRWEKHHKFSVSWLGESDELSGRESYAKYFNRKDLKMVSKS